MLSRLKTVSYMGLLSGVVVLLASPPASSRADSPWLYGIHFYGDVGASNVETMTGGKGIWSLEIVVTNSDPWWHAAVQRDIRFNHMLAQGHSIICRIEPQWGYAVPKEPDYPMATYLPQVRASAEALSDTVRIWHVGNEMNLLPEYGGDVLTAADYVDAFRQIRAEIKAVPNSLGEQLVLLGPVSPGPMAPGVRHTDGTVYLAQMCALLGHDEVDGFAIHSYAAPWLDAAQSRQDYQAGYLAQLAVIDHYGFSDKPVYITEWNRATNVDSAAEEARTAQFLHGAYTDLHAWNQRDRAHPISAACWFIYQYDANPDGWQKYSLEYLHTVHEPGADNDAWDAFNYACSLDLPTASPSPGGIEDRMLPGTPPGHDVTGTASISADSNPQYAARAIDDVIDTNHRWFSTGNVPLHWLQLDLGQERALSGFKIYHATAGGDHERYNTEAYYFESAPSAGGPWTIEEAVYTQSESDARTYLLPQHRRHVRFTIADPGSTNYAVVPEVEIYAIRLGDMDDDGDQDLHDLAGIQACTSGEGNTEHSPSCLPAHLDTDADVDAADLLEFEQLMTGPGVAL